MSAGARAWIAAASVGVVEALKDQGFARWNYSLRSLQKEVCGKYLGSCSQLKRFSSSINASYAAGLGVDRLKQPEESMRNVMYLRCWGPN